MCLVLRGCTVPILRFGPHSETQWMVGPDEGSCGNPRSEFGVMFRSLLMVVMLDFPPRYFEVTETPKARRIVLGLSIPREEDLGKEWGRQPRFVSSGGIES